MSISTTSGTWRPNASTASSPEPAPSTVQPSSSSASLTASRMRSSSSTARIRVPTRTMMPESWRDSGGTSVPLSTRSRSRDEQRRTSSSKMPRRRRPARSSGHGRASGEVADAAAGLAGDQLAGGHVPRVETCLEVRVEAPRRDVAQVERSRPEAADVAHRRRSVARPRRPVACAAPVGRRTPCHEGQAEVGAAAAGDRLAVRAWPRRRGSAANSSPIAGT